MPRHAYLITANGNFGVLNACLRMLDAEGNDFYLMFDRKAFATPAEACSQLYTPHLATIRYAGLRTVNWGSYSQVEAVMTLMQQAVQADAGYAYLHFLQNADLPIKSDAEIRRFFSEHEGTEFVNVDFSGNAWAERCCRYRYFLSHNRYYRACRLLKGLNLLLARVQEHLHIMTNKDMHFYYGSALFSVTQPFAAWLVARREEVRRRFRWALAPDEKFVQTMLMASPFASHLSGGGNFTTNVMLISWTREREKNSPHVWRADEFGCLTSAPAECCYARKFLERVDTDIVKMLESHVNRRR